MLAHSVAATPMRRYRAKHGTDFDVDTQQRLGDGYGSVVYLATNVTTQSRAAAKVINLGALDDWTVQAVRGERAALVLLGNTHPHIVKLLDVYESDAELVFFLTLAQHGDLHALMGRRDSKRLLEVEARYVFLQLLDALDHAHRYSIAHRDLKPENVLLMAPLPPDAHKGCAEPLHILLGDWGMCASTRQRQSRSCGSPLYAAPEVVLGVEYDATQIDVWSLGIMLYTMVAGNQPFQPDAKAGGFCFKSLYARIVSEPARYPWTFSPELCKLLDAMLNKAPACRPSIAALRTHEWTSDPYVLPLYAP